MKRAARPCWLALCAVLLSACVFGNARTITPNAAPSLEIGLARADGSRFWLSEQRGKPLLVFLFATYDNGSQLALAHLESLLAHEKRIAALGIALQPDAQMFLEPYQASLSVSFPLSYDPYNALLRGETDLGRVAAVPAFAVLDAEGHVLATRYGITTEAELKAWLQSVVPGFSR